MPDVVFLSRVQFALTIMFHYLFPPLTIGMGVVLVYLEGMYLWSREPIYETAARFWTSLYAIGFAMGVATGIVMEFEFGTNWAVYSRFVGDLFGAALAVEEIFAFFLESGLHRCPGIRMGPRDASISFRGYGHGIPGVDLLLDLDRRCQQWQQTPAGHSFLR